jgi:ABC-2 type transport system permease protein
MNDTFRQTRLILRHDLRLLWRDVMATSWRDYLNVGLVVVLFLIANAIAISIFFAFRRAPPLGAETLAWFFFAFLMLGTAMNHAIKLLFERSDFDLLLSAPVSPRAILFARIASISAGAALTVAVLLLPLLNGALLAVSPGYACGYLVWLLLSCAVASAGVWFTLLLVQWLGPQRARTWAQVVAAVLGASIFLLTQAQNFMPLDDRGRFLDAILRFVARPWVAFLPRAGRGEALPLLGLLAVAGLFMTLTTRLLGRIFISGVQEGNAIATPGKKRKPGRQHVFAAGVVRATFWKDVRLIVRDPLLLAQVLPTALYLLPALFGFRHFAEPAVMLGPAALVLAAQFSMSLTAVCAAGEECWDLIRMSPTSEMRLRLAKMAAGMALPMIVSVLLCLALALLGHPLLALLALVFSLGCGAAAAWLQVAHIEPTPRRDILRRRRKAGQSLVANLSVTLLMLSGAGGLVLAASTHWIVATALLVVTTVGIVGCFTLVSLEEIPQRHFTAARDGS